MWNKEELAAHERAAMALDDIKNRAFYYISKTPKVTEYDVQQFIVAEYRARHMLVDKDPPIVGFGAHSAIPHYFPAKRGSSVIKPNTFILIDVWSRFNKGHSPFADITWVGFYGKKIPAEIVNGYALLIAARDAAVDLLQRQLKKGIIPSGADVDMAATDVIEKVGYAKYMLHRTGHALGFSSPHARARRVNKNNPYSLAINVGYTIEPGIYLKNKFGIRSEIDFYIDRQLKLHITTPVQRGIIKI